MKKAPTWLTGTTPALEDAQSTIKRRIRVRNWLRKRRTNYFYRQAEVKRQRDRRAAQREQGA